MGADIEHRLAAAAAQLREYEIAVSRVTELRHRRHYFGTQINELRAVHALEERDVERLERLSLTRIVATLRGARDDIMAREQAEAEVARYRVDEAQDRLDALDHQYRSARARVDALASAPAAYDAILAEKERHLAESTDPRGRRLLILADERGRLSNDARELDEAIEAAQTARQALAALGTTLRSVAGWTTYDSLFGDDTVKQSRLDDAAQEAQYADHCLLLLRTELADVAGTPLHGWAIPTEGLTHFIAIWLDHVTTDLAVRERIRSATDNVESCARRVRNLIHDLWRRAGQTQDRLAAIDAERREVLNGQST